jgi:hypothetical protein
LIATHLLVHIVQHLSQAAGFTDDRQQQASSTVSRHSREESLGHLPVANQSSTIL